MDELARKLAQELLDSGKDLYREQYPVTRNQQKTEEVIVVIAIKTDRRGEQILKEMAEHFETKAVAGPKGNVCPVCNGTGRI